MHRYHFSFSIMPLKAHRKECSHWTIWKLVAVHGVNKHQNMVN